jgi:digeranylgeranylglycerophospholipid reductase
MKAASLSGQTKSCACLTPLPHGTVIFWHTSVEQFDLAIIGGGFAGLTCAQAAAARGARTVVFERKNDPGSAPHTTGLIVKELADYFDIPQDFTRKIRGVRVYAPNLHWVDLETPAGYHFLATDTPALLRWLADQATAAGAEVRCDQSFTSADSSPHGLRMSSLDAEARFLVGCDGAKSRIGQFFRLGQNTRFLAGVESEYTGLKGVKEDRLHVFFDSELAPGYIAWVVPGFGDTFQIGLATRQGGILRMNALIQKLGRVFDFSEAQITGKRGGLIPCGGVVRPIYNDKVMVLGDAAGMVSPLTAGGIHPSMEIGRIAGVALAGHLVDGGPHPGRRVAKAAPSFRFKNMMRRAFTAMPPPDWLLNTVLDGPFFFELAQLVFFHHRGLLSPEAWQRLGGGRPPSS